MPALFKVRISSLPSPSNTFGWWESSADSYTIIKWTRPRTTILDGCNWKGWEIPLISDHQFGHEKECFNSVFKLLNLLKMLKLEFNDILPNKLCSMPLLYNWQFIHVQLSVNRLHITCSPEQNLKFVGIIVSQMFTGTWLRPLMTTICTLQEIEWRVDWL